jgi:hypothetical protein
MSQILGEGTRVPVVAPRGLDEIVATFGDIFDYIHPDHSLDPRWQTDFLERTALPFPMVLSWDRTRTVHQITCHKVLSGIFADVFLQIQRAGLQNKITGFGGCFSFRPQRTGTKLSAHAWGIAIDLKQKPMRKEVLGTWIPRS